MLLRQYTLSNTAPELYIVDSECCQVLQYILIL